MPLHERRRVAVVFDSGAASPLEILTAARGWCDVVFLCDPSIPYVAEQLPTLGRLATVVEIGDVQSAGDMLTSHGVEGIVTFSEQQIRRTAQLAQAADLTAETPEVAATLTDKLAQRTALARAGVQTTRTRLVTTKTEALAALAEIGTPAVLKPRHGAGSVDTYRINSGADLEQAFPDGTPTGDGFVIEEMYQGDPTVAGVPFGDYVSVEALAADGTVVPVSVTGRLPLAEPFRETGLFTPAALPEETVRAVCDLAVRAVQAIGVRHSTTHTEIKLTPDGPRIIEVNGRMGGSIANVLHRASGFNLVRATLERAAGQPLHPPRIDYRRVAFEYLVAAPAAARTFTALHGLEKIRQLPGFVHLDVLATPGQALDARLGIQYLASVYGTADDHEGLASTLHAIERELVMECR